MNLNLNDKSSETLVNCLKTIYDSEEKKWKYTEDFSTKKINIKTIKFMTYNVWFDQYNWENRLKAVAKIIEDKDSDIICLQEVTDSFINFLLQNEFVQKNYVFHLVPNNIKNWYDVAILSKFNCEGYISRFVTRMGRKLLFIDIPTENLTIRVGSVHLESLNNMGIRENQFIHSYKTLDSNSNKNYLNILAGDFNFTEKENSLISSSGYIDVGLEIIKLQEKIPNDQEKFEFDQSKYCTMKGMKGYPPWRPDRFTYKSSSSLFSIIKYEIIGKEPIDIIDKNNPVDTPSDHYALYLEFSL